MALSMDITKKSETALLTKHKATTAESIKFITALNQLAAKNDLLLSEQGDAISLIIQAA
jgi:hypothetical protein